MSGTRVCQYEGMTPTPEVALAAGPPVSVPLPGCLTAVPGLRNLAALTGHQVSPAQLVQFVIGQTVQLRVVWWRRLAHSEIEKYTNTPLIYACMCINLYIWAFPSPI